MGTRMTKDELKNYKCKNMLLSLNWLKEFIDIPKKITPEEIAAVLTNHVVEVEGFYRQADKYKGVVVGEVLEAVKHPNADRLKKTLVDIGSEKLEIVCGAPNVEAGQFVAVATVGTVLPNDLEIKESEIRGVKSSGMICAEDELGLGGDHSGIMVLGARATKGMMFADYLEVGDVVFEIDNKSLSNRSDLFGHYGMARELAVLLNLDLKEPKIEKGALEIGDSIKIEVKVEDEKLCPRYSALAFSDIRIEESPRWLRERLIAVGQKPINNIVDITNYIMFELGQPTHAFDFGLLKGRNEVAGIFVRRAKKNETIATLDGEKRILDSDVLVIANADEPVAIAGVMGGQFSGVTAETVDIILEVANFNAVSVRKTSQRFSLRTESSVRYEKTLDPQLCELALKRVVSLIGKVCVGSRISSVLVDEYKVDDGEKKIELEYEWLCQKIGMNIAKEKIEVILRGLGFSVSFIDDKIMITVPSWRAVKDVSIPEDIVEEVARVIGYNNIPTATPASIVNVAVLDQEKKLERRLKQLLSGVGLSEVQNYSFVNEEQLKKMGENTSSYLKLLNPVSAIYSLLRKNLAPNLIVNVRANQAKYDKVKLFEIGSVFFPYPGELAANAQVDKLPFQEKVLGLVLAGTDSDEVFSEMKGILEYVFEKIGGQVSFCQTELSLPWSGEVVASIKTSDDESIGMIYALGTAAKSSLGVKKAIVIAELHLSAVLKSVAVSGPKPYEELDKYPALVRDLAFVINEKILYNEVKVEISEFDDLIRRVELFDVYAGDKLAADQKSLAFHISFQVDRTLRGEEVDEVQNRLVKHLEEKFGAVLRNF